MMPDPNTPVGEPEHKDPVGGTPDATPSPPHRVFATEDDLKQYDAKRSEKYERELTKLRREFEALKATSLTEDQQKAETQRQALEAERAKMLEDADRRAGFLGVALSNGLTKEQATKWYSLAGDEWVDPQEAFAAVGKDLGWKSQNDHRPVGGGGGRNPELPGEEKFTPEYVEEMIFKNGSAWYAPRQKKIQAWQEANLPSPVRRIS